MPSTIPAPTRVRKATISTKLKKRPISAAPLEELTESALSASIEATSIVEPTSSPEAACVSSTNSSSARVTNAMDAEPFRLLDLPFEVRHMIYKVLLISVREISLTQPTVPGHVTDHLNCSTCSLNLPRNLPLNHQIMYTCKSLYKEALPIFYQLNTFSIRAHDRTYRNCPLSWTDMQLHGAGLLRLRRLKLEAPMPKGILKGSVYSFWHQLLRKCPSLEHVSLVSVGCLHGIRAGETAITLAWNIAKCFSKNTPASATESISLVINLKIERPYNSYIRTGEHLRNVVLKSGHSPMSMVEGLTIEVQETLDPQELEILEAYKLKGWTWRRISEEVGGDGHHVVLHWRKT